MVCRGMCSTWIISEPDVSSFMISRAVLGLGAHSSCANSTAILISVSAGGLNRPSQSVTFAFLRAGV